MEIINIKNVVAKNLETFDPSYTVRNIKKSFLQPLWKHKIFGLSALHK